MYGRGETGRADGMCLNNQIGLVWLGGINGEGGRGICGFLLAAKDPQFGVAVAAIS